MATVAASASASASRTAPRRLLVVGAPVLYAVALAVSIAAWGLPIARDQLFFWLALGMLASTAGRWRTWGRLVVDWLPLFGLLVLYDVLRGAVGTTPALAHVTPQLDLDRFLGGGAVPTVWLQEHLWHPDHLRAYDYAIWTVYMSHFFVVWTVAAVLWRASRERFRRYLLVMVPLTLGAFLTYWLYPAQPPWLVAQDGGLAGHVDRIVPAVWGQLGVGTAQSVYENGDLVNTVAAMPSLHAAYPCMLLLFFWPAGRVVRAALGLYTLAMGFTLVYGGEHFVADILAGWAMAGVLFAGVAQLTAFRTRRSTAPRPRPGG